MNSTQIKAIQTEIGTSPDGFWGPKSIAACQKYIRSLMPSGAPKSDQASLTRAFGKPGDESRLVKLDLTGLGLKYTGQPISSTRCNKAVADYLLAVYKELTTFEEGRLFLAQFDGCYSNRPMRGGSLPSLHARGAAVDHMAGTNGLKTHWPTKATMPFSVIKVFAKHGWLSAAVFWSRDAMHFQYTQ